MHVLTINGSHKKTTGLTGRMLAALERGVCSAGGSAESIDLSRLDIGACRACGVCQTRLDGRCAVASPDDADRVFARMRSADVVVYGTPVYLFAPSSRLKALLERFHALGQADALVVSQAGLLFHAIDRRVCARPFVAVVSCDNVEPATTRITEDYFRTFSRFIGAPMLGLLVRNAGRRILDGQARVTEADVMTSCEKAGRELVRLGRVTRATERALRRSSLPISNWVFQLLKRTRRGRAAVCARGSSHPHAHTQP